MATVQVAKKAPGKVWPKAEGKIGKNAAYEINERGIMTVTIDLNVRLGASKSGKTTIIATSEGNQKIEGGGDAVIGLNVYTKD